jgi:catechol 2,3-dioxygenase-like lactoylglutathione lyase family enzyme
MLRPKALDHVGLLATDMDKTLRFYQVLGLEVLRTSGPRADGERSAVLRVGNQEINVFSRPDFVLPDRDTPPRIDHFCLTMDAASMDDLVADLRQAGVDIAKGPVERRDGTALFVHDPDGVRVELRIPK